MIEVIYKSKEIAEVVISNTSKKNAIDRQMWRSIRDLSFELSSNQDVRVVIIYGEGGDFSSGADLSDPSLVEFNGLTRMREIAQALSSFKKISKPTIAKVRGICVGAGMGLAMAADLIVAAKKARFSQIFTLRGLAVDGGSSWSLPRLVGVQRAKELAFFGEFISGQEAESLGLVSRSIDDEELDEFVEGWAKRLAKAPTVALSLTKKLINESFHLSFDDALENEAVAQSVVFSTQDAREAMIAFANKREPHFQGR